MTETTQTTIPAPNVLKRAAIIGTAQSMRQCPWHDNTLEVWGLNDSYMLNIPRANRWFDLHPFHQMYFRDGAQQGGQTVIPSSAAREIPLGVYLRPAGHLQWLKTRGFPVYLLETSPEYPTGVTFPQEKVFGFFKQFWPLRLTRKGTIVAGDDYEVSTPSLMLMTAIVEGYREIHVYGIHLATEWEYVQQRPNFEFLLGIAAGLGIKVVLPEMTPICKANYKYAFEPKGDLPLQIAQQSIDRIKGEGQYIRQRLNLLPWWAYSQKQDFQRRLGQLEIDLLDARQRLQRTQLAA